MRSTLSRVPVNRRAVIPFSLRSLMPLLVLGALASRAHAASGEPVPTPTTDHASKAPASETGPASQPAPQPSSQTGSSQVPSQTAQATGDTTDDDTAKTLPTVEVQSTRSYAEKNQVPGSTASITAAEVEQTINVMNTEDALKYLPDVLVRKRYIGDTQAPMATRTTGINASARSLIYADDVLLSTLINNNNGNGSPQWFMVSPQEIDRIDVLYGPYSAMFPGNSYGAVTQITTRMPKHFEASADVSVSTQHFNLYGTNENEPAQQYSAMIGDRNGKLSWRLSANHLDSFSQPLTFATITQSITPAGTDLPVVSGGYADRNRTGGAIQVIGAGNLVHTIQDNATLKVGYDFTPTLSATYTLGYWQNDSKAQSQTYLSTATGAPYYGAGSGSVNIGGFAYSANTIAGQFSSNNVEQEHLMQSLKVETHTQGVFDWEMVLSNFYYLQDLSRLSTGLYPAALSGGPGRTTDMEGSGWSTADLKGTWRPQGLGGANIVSFGAHYDQFKLVSPTFTTTNWESGSEGALFSNSVGNTQTTALWLQDVWRLTPSLTATVGARYESWRAYNGSNFSIGSNGVPVSINQPGVSQSGLSPKASLNWDLNDTWSLTGSFGKALRFPTVGELYQTVQTGTTFVQANPFLSPESVLSGELALERHTDNGTIRLSVFDEYVSNALISQTSNIPGFATPVSFTQNVGKTRETGAEIVAQQKDVFIRGLDLSGNLTYVNARILSDPSYVPTTPGATAVGKQTPYVPTWRATLVATWHPDDKWALTAAARYSSRLYATVDNTDVNPSTYQGFESFFVVDVRAHYQIDKHWGAAVGVDNLNNQKYYLFHPFPQRTFYAELKYDL
jgi:iron complex outermembrane receptor protein